MNGSSPPRLPDTRWLTRPEIQAVFAALAARGFRARAVGGAVRNALLGREVTDIDLATTAQPPDIITAVEAAGLKVVPTGLAHGTITVVSGAHAVEVTTLRKDVATHGRHATVAFTEDWLEDARRRDFTINALYCEADGQVFDPLGGYGDLVARRVRFIGDAATRIREDYLRILRFFRIAAEYGDGPLDKSGLEACVREQGGLSILSAERVRRELLLLLGAPRALEVLQIMFDHGLVTPVLRSAPRITLLDRLASIETSLRLKSDGLLRLAVLVVEVDEDADRLRARLRLSNEEHERLLHATSRTPIGPRASEAAAKARLYAEGALAYRDRALIEWTRSGEPPSDDEWRRRLALPERWLPPRFPIDGADVIAIGIPAGPRVGEVLRALQAWWISQDYTTDESALREKLRELANSS